jgi:hypothetical protein
MGLVPLFVQSGFLPPFLFTTDLRVVGVQSSRGISAADQNAVGLGG